MAYEHIKFPDGTTAIICGMRGSKKFCSCGRVADLLCDWKVKTKKSGTCDRPICRDHALEVAPDKHLCQEHQRAWADWCKRRRDGLPDALKPQGEQLSLL